MISKPDLDTLLYYYSEMEEYQRTNLQLSISDSKTPELQGLSSDVELMSRIKRFSILQSSQLMIPNFILMFQLNKGRYLVLDASFHEIVRGIGKADNLYYGICQVMRDLGYEELARTN